MSKKKRERNQVEGDGSPVPAGMARFYWFLGVVAVLGIGIVGYAVGLRTDDSTVSRPIRVVGLDDPGTLMSLARGIAEEQTDEDDESPRWDKDGKLVAARPMDEERGQLLQPADEIYIKKLIQQNVLAALKNTKQQVTQERGGCRWADLMKALTDIETAQKGHKEPKNA